MRIRPFDARDEAEIVRLWVVCGLTRPWNDPHADIARKVAHSPAGFLVAEEAGVVVGSVMAGYDGHRGWVNYLAVHPSHRGRGLGRSLMQAAEKVLLEQGCPKVNLQMRLDNEAAREFYEAIGYGKDAVTSFGKRLISDEEPG